MVGLTVGAAAIVITAGAGTPAVAGAGVGLVADVVGLAGGAGTGAMVGGSAGAGMATGAIAGAASASTATGAAIGAAAGATSAAAVTSSTAGGAAIVSGGLALGPIGWLALGTDTLCPSPTYDCWKPVLHDTSPEPSSGRLLKDVAADPRIRRVIIDNSTVPLPKVMLENNWGETFLIEYIVLPSKKIAAHALRV